MHAMSAAVTATLTGIIMTDEATRKAIKVWMREVMNAKNWTANEWARRAGTSPTNITRFLSPTSHIVPSSSTVSKLARVAGSQPKLNPLESLHASRAFQVPVFSAQLVQSFNPTQLWDYAVGQSASVETIAVDGPVEGPAFVSDVPSHGMVGRGVQPGDRVLVEKVKRADLQPGHVVLFQHEGTVRIGEWQGTLIVFYPPAGQQDPQFRPLRSSDVEVYGRVRRLIREL